MIAEISILVVLLVCVWNTLKAKRILRATEARLEIAKCVTEIERMMLDGEIKSGDHCHDHLAKRMAEMQTARSWSYTLSLRLTPEQILTCQRIDEEIKKKSQLGDVLGKYHRSLAKAVKNQQPLLYARLYCWMLFAGGGMRVYVRCLMAVLKGILAILKGLLALHSFASTVKKAWSNALTTQDSKVRVGELIHCNSNVGSQPSGFPLKIAL